MGKLLGKSNHTRVVPVPWSKALISPVHKKGERISQNFRPISCLDSLRKIYESCLLSRLTDIVDPLISETQMGFRRNLSCCHAAITALEFAKDIQKKTKDLAFVTLDITKAFDSLPKEVALSKLKEKVGNTDLLKATTELLRKPTKIKVKTPDGLLSNEYEIKVGTPQGSILSPMLFIVAIDSLTKVLSDERIGPEFERKFYPLYLFADDALLVCRIKQSQLALNKLEEEAKKLGLLFSAQKSNILTGKKKKNPKYNLYINGE
jgi:retron-type reverse transcriptase